SIRIIFFNGGKSTASDFVIASAVSVIDGSMKDAIDYYRKISPVGVIGLPLASRSEYEFQIDLNGFAPPLTSDQVMWIKGEAVHIYVVGEASYKDEQGRPHKRYFKATYNPSVNYFQVLMGGPQLE